MYVVMLKSLDEASELKTARGWDRRDVQVHDWQRPLRQIALAAPVAVVAEPR